MTKRFLIFVLAASVVSMGGAGCKKQLEDAYTNPNAPAQEPVENIFPSLIGAFVGSFSSAGTAYGLAGDDIIIGRYIQYWNNNTITATDNGGTQYDQMGGTIGTSDNLGSFWAAFYYGQGQNLNRIVEWGKQQQKWDYVGGALAIRAWGWLQLANEYGDAVIVKEAFNTSLQQFDYDPQQMAYDSCRAVAFQALQYLNTTGGAASPANFAIGDAFCNGGDVNKWKKFVYGVMARSYYYLSNKADYKPDSVIKYCDLAMTSNADNTTAKFAAQKTSGTSNYFGPFRGNVGSLRQSAYIANLMSGLNSVGFTGVTDPRTWYILRENPDSTFKGVLPGQEGINTLTANLRPQNFWGNVFTSTGAPATDQGRYIFRDAAEWPIMTAAEIQFLKAEAAFRKGDKVTALAAYSNGISLNIDMLTTTYATNVPANKVITPAVKAAFLANTAVVPTDPSTLTLTQILLQKYIAMYGFGVMETWADMRRYHYNKDLDAATGKPVYPDFQPAGGGFYLANAGQPVYRARPRYNSEFIYDIPSLKLVGAVDASNAQVPTYHTKETWFTQH